MKKSKKICAPRTFAKRKSFSSKKKMFAAFAIAGTSYMIARLVSGFACMVLVGGGVEVS